MIDDKASYYRPTGDIFFGQIKKILINLTQVIDFFTSNNRPNFLKSLFSTLSPYFFYRS